MKQTLIALGIAFLLIGGALALSPDPVYAQAGGLVPCNGPECQACHLTQLAQNVIEFFVYISFIIAALAFAIAGMLYFGNAGKEDRIKHAHQIFSNTFIGIIIILTSWLVIDVILHTLVGEGVRPFTEIQCVSQGGALSDSPSPNEKNIRIDSSLGGVTPTTPSLETAEGSLLTSTQIIQKIQATEQYESQLCGTAQSLGIPEQCKRLRAIMAVESAGNPKAENKGSTGLMQIQPGTARALDPQLESLSDSQIQNILISDPNKNIELGAKYYKSLLEKYDGDKTLATAAYNGGPSANDPSKDCPGMRRWQCLWDNPEHTVPNTGYAETRVYVPNIVAVEKALGAN